MISALNARSTYFHWRFGFDYHHYLPWLPHSFDSYSSWLAFWNFLALGCAFWAIRDWLLGKTTGEEKAEYQHHKQVHAAGGIPWAAGSTQEVNGPSRAAPRAMIVYLPARLRRLLWVLCINGGLLGLESIIQRLSGTGKLLWLVDTTVNKGAETQLGPYAYRSNGAQYFNLLWPVCLGFWWMLHRSGGFQRNQHHWLLGCGVAMAVSSIISLSRGGALVAVSILVLAAFYLLTTHYLFSAPKDQRFRRGTAAVLFIFFSTALVLGFKLGWKQLQPRLEEVGLGFDQRQQMYDLARPMADDYPWFGTGPGTFEPLFQFYRPTLDTYWPAQLHNDWLETRITFGWVGSALVAGALVTVLLRWFVAGGIHGGRRFVILFWLALGGCLVHARFDFPFQIYSILFLFLLLCAILSNLSRRPG